MKFLDGTRCVRDKHFNLSLKWNQWKNQPHCDTMSWDQKGESVLSRIASDHGSEVFEDIF